MNLTPYPYPADDSLQRAKAETDELLRELDKLRQASKQECQQLYFQTFLGKSVLPMHLASNEYQRGFFDGYVAGKAETLSTRREETASGDIEKPPKRDDRACAKCDYANFDDKNGRLFCCRWNSYNAAGDWCCKFIPRKGE